MSLLQRCKDCGEIIADDQDFKEGEDDPDLCELCNEVNTDARAH